jgi:hypothetical protein
MSFEIETENQNNKMDKQMEGEEREEREEIQGVCLDQFANTSPSIVSTTQDSSKEFLVSILCLCN